MISRWRAAGWQDAVEKAGLIPHPLTTPGQTIYAHGLIIDRCGKAPEDQSKRGCRLLARCGSPCI